MIAVEPTTSEPMPSKAASVRRHLSQWGRADQSWVDAQGRDAGSSPLLHRSVTEPTIYKPMPIWLASTRWQLPKECSHDLA